MNNEKGSVEGLKDKLYSRANKDTVEDVRAPLSQSDADMPKAWADQKHDLPPRERRPFMPTPTSRMSFATKFFIVSAGFFLVALAVGAIAFWWGPNTISPNNIDIQIVAPSLVDGGKEADFQIIIDNKNPAELQLADLVIDYPDGSRDPKNPTQSLLHERQSVGTIPAAGEVKRTAAAILYGSEGQQETIRATLEYSVAGSNAIFTRQTQTTITVGSSPVSVTVNSPNDAVSGQDFPLDVVVRSNATQPVNNVAVQGQLPFGFTIASSDPATSGGTIWRLGTLQPGETQTIHITGSIDGQDGDQRVFKFLVGQTNSASDPSVQVPFLTMPATVTVSRPFVGASLSINGSTAKNVSAGAGSTVQGTVNWQNNLTSDIQNVEIVLKLDGPMIDKSSINPGTGFYRSSDNSIVWTSEQDPTLADAQAGASGQLTFSFNTFAPGQGGVVYTNPTATLALSVQAQRPGDTSGLSGAITSSETTQVSFASQITLTASAQYASGPNPPMANQVSGYTVTWNAKNSSNAVGSAMVTTTLPPYVTFVSGGPGISYDSGSRTVTWQIGDLPAGSGYTKGAVSNSFQVSLTPSTSQVGQAVPLTGSATLSGTDRFASVKVQASIQPVNTVDNVVGSQ
jgi:hypothetical protein